MSIDNQMPPDESVQALRQAFDQMHPAQSHMQDMLKQVQDAPMEHLPHPVYSAGLDDMAADDGLRKARIVGWRYLAQSSKGDNYLIELHQHADGSHHFAGISRGRRLEAMLQVLEAAKSHPKLGGGVYTFSVFLVNALGVFALWFHGNDTDQEIVAIPPVPSGLQPWPRIYTVEQFQDALRSEAQLNRAYDVAAQI
jgi:hypothetical protein